MSIEDDMKDLKASAATQQRCHAWTPSEEVAEIIKQVVYEREAYEMSNGAEGTLMSAVKVCDWLRRKKGVSVSATTLDRYVASKYGRRSLSTP